MALHGRYINSDANTDRVTVTFRREDLLWKTGATLTAPDGQHQVRGLPMQVDGLLVGPTILDMMVRQVVPVTDELRERYEIPDDLEEVAFWVTRPTSTLWPAQGRPGKQTGQKAKMVDHPFQPGLASGGRRVSEEGDFVRVDKLTKVSISSLALKLAVGMTGGLSSAYTRISALASQAWAADLQRALTLWQRISATDKLLEDDEIAQLRPTSSISQEVEREVMRQACTWLGVDPDLDCSRLRGRPRQASTETGKIVLMTVTADERLHGELLADFYGIKAGTSLSDLELQTLVELLGALRTGQYEVDAELVEAFLDAAAPDWREQAAAGETSDVGAAASRYDPYDILGVPRDATLEDVTRAYRRAMQRVHPDTSQLGRGLAQIVSEAYRNIRQERGEE